jgi:hypothetical protein
VTLLTVNCKDFLGETIVMRYLSSQQPSAMSRLELAKRYLAFKEVPESTVTTTGESCGGLKPITRFSECKKISLGFALVAEGASRLAHDFAGSFKRHTIIIRELRQHPGEKKHRKRRGLAAVATDQERARGVLR